LFLLDISLNIYSLKRKKGKRKERKKEKPVVGREYPALQLHVPQLKFVFEP